MADQNDCPSDHGASNVSSATFPWSDSLQVSRRAILGLFAGVGAGTLLPTGAPRAATPRSVPGATVLPKIGAVPFDEPPVIAAQDGLLDTVLTVQLREERSEGEVLRYRTYNGLFTGPTLLFRPGDKVRVRLDNNLPPEEMQGGMSGDDPNQPHGFNVTNLHTHGLWVSPAGNSDNVLIAIAPGKTFQHEYLIPVEHVAGTFWYHPHKHGSVEMQVTNGMSGAMIIEGGVDDLPEIGAAGQRLMVLQQIQPEADARRTAAAITVAAIAGAPNKVTTINGLRAPTLTLRPKAVERWRLVAANYHDLLHIEVRPADSKATIPLHPIAYDGIPVRNVTPADRVRLAPGNRVDVMLQPPEAGDYVIWKIGDQGQFDVLPDDEIIGYLRVEGDAPSTPMTIPDQISPDFSHPDIEEAEVTNKRKVLFSVVPQPDGSVRFEIDNRRFESGRVDQAITLGAVEEWRLENDSDTTHPFHIHVNPFQVVKSSDPLLGPRTWLDTVPIPPAKDGVPGYVIMRTRIERFIGRFVQHCHILGHEDRGMMQLIEISPPKR